MTKFFMLPMFCLATILMSTSTFGQSLTAQSIVKIEKEIDAFFSDMIKAAEKLDYDYISNGVDDSHKSSFIVNNTYYESYDAMVSFMKENKPSGATQSIKIDKKKITVLSDKSVLLTASGESVVNLNPGQSFTAKFYWTFVFQKINNEWKVIHSHQSGR